MLSKPSISIAAVALLATACSDVACLAIPCLPPPAIKITVTTSAGATIPNASFSAGGPTTAAGPCLPQGECIIQGGGGLYVLDISAPGYQTVRQQVFVRQSEPSDCGCRTVETQELAVKLVQIAD